MTSLAHDRGSFSPVSHEALARMKFRYVALDDEWEQLKRLYAEHIESNAPGTDLSTVPTIESGVWLGAFAGPKLCSALWFDDTGQSEMMFCLIWNRGREETLASMRLMVSFIQTYAHRHLWFISLSVPDAKALLMFHRGGFRKTMELPQGLARYDRGAV